MGDGLIVFKIGQSVVLQLSACFDQDQIAVDEKMGHGTLGPNQEQHPFRNAVRHIQHRSHHAFREFLKGSFDSFTGLGAGPENDASRVF